MNSYLNQVKFLKVLKTKMPVNPKIYEHLVLFDNRFVEERGDLSNFFDADLRFLNKKKPLDYCRGFWYDKWSREELSQTFLLLI